MPSFLSKVFGRRKDELANGHTSTPVKALPKHKASNPSLLEGKFEQVVTPETPIQTSFANALPTATPFVSSPLSKATSREGVGFGLFRSRSRPASPLTTHKPLDELPSLTLALPTQQGDTDGDGLGVNFEGESRLPLLEESVIGAMRLNVEECKQLVDACTKVILERGLETLGLMHPHWHSASQDTQRKLISLYIQSLAGSPASVISPNSFEKELRGTRSPHDVAAILRWGLRHLQFNSPSFSLSADVASTRDEWEWYKTFLTSERSQQYPPSAFTTLLTPLLPKPHLALLLSILELSGSLAAHAEGNGTSWSRLCMMWGVWLLCAKRDAVFGGGETGWEEFYGIWDKSGRILEHLFLARIRDESQTHRMPLRLTELVTHYPYTSKGEESSIDFLNRPRFSTRAYDALFVRIDTEVEKERSGVKRKKEDLLKLLGVAFGAELVGLEAEKTKEGEGEKVDKVDGLWEIVRKAADGQAGDVKEKKPVLSRVFADETIRLLRLLPGSDSEGGIHLEEPILRRRSESLSATEPEHLNTKQPPLFVRTSPANIPLPPSPKEAFDWAQFSSAGFGGNSSVGQHLSKTLLDTDVEVTKPSSSTVGLARRLSRKRGSRSRSRRTSVEIVTPTEKDSTNSRKELKSHVKAVNIIKLDEAFIDFWSDAVVDPTAAEWPTFVVAKLNLTGNSNLKAIEVEGKPVRWIILERTYSVPLPPPFPASPDGSATSHVPEANGANGAASPRPSLRSLSASTRKRFSFLSGGNVVSSGKVEKSTSTKRRTPKIGEMGEVLPEVQEKEEKKDEKPAKGGRGFKAAAVGLGTAVLGGIGVKDAVDAKSKEELAKAEEIPVPVPTAEGETLPLAPETVVGGGDTSSSHTTKASEPAAIAGAAPTPVAEGPEPTPPLAEDTPEPYVTAETAPTSIEPLKSESEGEGEMEMEKVPLVPASVEESLAPVEAAPRSVAEAVPTPQPVEEPVPEPVEEAASEPIKEVPPEPVEEAPEPIEEPAPEPVEKTAPEPVEEAAPVPIEGSVPELVSEAASEPVEEVAPVPVGEPAPEEAVPVPVEEAAPWPVGEPAPESVEEAAPEPVEDGVAAAVEGTPVPEAIEAPVAVGLGPAEETQPDPEAQPGPEPIQGTVPPPVEEAAHEEPVAAAEEPSFTEPGAHEDAHTELKYIASESEIAAAEPVTDASHEEQPTEHAESHVEES